MLVLYGRSKEGEEWESEYSIYRGELPSRIMIIRIGVGIGRILGGGWFN